MRPGQPALGALVRPCARSLMPVAMLDPVASPSTFDALMALPSRGAAHAATMRPIPYTLLYIFCDLCIPLNIGLAPLSGVLFHFPTALGIVLAGGTAAAMVAFFLSRALLQQHVLTWLDNRPRMQRHFSFIDRAITNGGLCVAKALA